MQARPQHTDRFCWLQTCQVLSFAHSFYSVCVDFNSHIVIQTYWAIFQKYNNQQMSTFSRYTFKDTFPNVTILTWCMLGALDWSLQKLYLYISWREKLCFLSSSHKSIIVTPSGLYNVVRHSQRCAPVCTHKTHATCADPENTHFLCFLVKCYGHQCQHTMVTSTKYYGKKL